MSLSLPIHLLPFYPTGVFIVFVLTYNTCGVFTVIFWSSLTEIDISNPTPITTTTQLKLDLCMKYILNLIYFINQVCVSVSQLDRTYHSLGGGGVSKLSSVNPTSRVKAYILVKMPQVTCLCRTKHYFYIPIDYTTSGKNLAKHDLTSDLKVIYPCWLKGWPYGFFCVGKGS